MVVTTDWVEALGNEVGQPVSRAYSVSWGRVESELGFRLPADYKRFVHWFGPGDFDEFFFVMVPGIQNPNLELRSWARSRWEGHRNLIQDEGVVEEGLADWSFPVYPNPGFLLSWGMTANGDAFYWDTSGDPEEWNIVVEDNGSFELFRFLGTLSDFLPRLLRDEIKIPFIAAAESGTPVHFNPRDGAWKGEGALQPFGRFG
jgi:hypothetical protein